MKPHGNSKLKTLAPERQEQLAAWLAMGTIEQARNRIWLEWGIRTSTAAISEFGSWYALRQAFTQAESFAEQFALKLVESPNFASQAELVGTASQIAFEAMALAAQDPKTFVALKRARQEDQRLRQEAAALDLAREKFEFDASAAALKEVDALKAIKADGGLDDQAKLNAVRQRLFGVTPK
jgi:hypothetical protein